MKSIKMLALFAAALFLLFSCKKDAGTGPVTPTFKKPNSILQNWEYNGTTWVRRGFMLLDLDHADNKDKSFMVVDVTPDASGFRFVLKKGPLPIDSLSDNWPAAVRKVSFGYSNDMIVNAAMRLQSQGFTATGQFHYLYDSIHHFPTAIATYNYLNNPVYAGSMAGKTPEGRATIMTPSGGVSRFNDIFYYFGEGMFTNVTIPGAGAQPFGTVTGPFTIDTERLKVLDAVMTVEGAYLSTLYFDFDKWEYFFFTDLCSATPGAVCNTGGTVRTANFISMNTLMNWPQGWGRQ